MQNNIIINENYRVRLIVPKDNGFDISKFLECLDMKKDAAIRNKHMRIDTAVTFLDVLPTMDSEYDRSVAKILVAANMSKSECCELRINPDRL